ncbi:MAG: hypothetical protein AB7J30_07440 [Hyphomicrobium sp.]
MIRRIALVVAVVGLFPIALAGLAFALSWAFECPISESGTRSCPAPGPDIYWLIEFLLISAVPASVMLIPPAMAVGVVWAVAEAINFFRAGPP